MNVPRKALVAGLMAVTAVLATGSCSNGADPVARPSQAVTTVPASQEPAAGPTYAATGLDLCGGTDLGVLSDLSLTVDRRDPTPPASGPGSSCYFGMHTAQGYDANLLVEVVTPESVEEAKGIYGATGRVTTMTADGAIAGLGDQADGFTDESEPSFKYSEYMIVVRRGNLVLKVWLAVGGDAFTPKATLATKVRTILEETLTTVPRS